MTKRWVILPVPYYNPTNYFLKTVSEVFRGIENYNPFDEICSLKIYPNYWEAWADYQRLQQGEHPNFRGKHYEKT